MPSWQARLFDGYSRLVIRRRRWGDERALANRARRLWGVPSGIGRLALRGLSVERVDREGVRGEWIRPPAARHGVVLYLHGGGYVACSSVTHRTVTAALAKATGHPVFAADYRLAPEHRFPAAHDDAVATYRWLSSQTGGAAIAVAGESAGGGLVLATAVAARDRGWPAPAGLVCFSPWTDLAVTGESIRSNAGRCAMFHPDNPALFAAAYLGPASPLDPRASPLYADLAGLPPAEIHVGSTELILDDARRVHDRINGAGGRSSLTEFGDVPHAWQLLVPLLPEARASVGQAARFIAECLAGR